MRAAICPVFRTVLCHAGQRFSYVIVPRISLRSLLSIMAARFRDVSFILYLWISSPQVSQLIKAYRLTIWYCCPYSILLVIIGLTIFPDAFGWKSLQIGLVTGGALTIRCFLGELAGGWVVDSVRVSR